MFWVGTVVMTGVIATGGCAKDPTAVVTQVDADATVPPLLKLRTTVARLSDPTGPSTAELTSSEIGDASNRPGAFVVPEIFSITVDASFAGPVTVTVEGLDWDTSVVTARGSTTTEVIAQKRTQAALTLTAVSAPPTDGDTDGDGGGAVGDGAVD
jgi:hypothetical protein